MRIYKLGVCITYMQQNIPAINSLFVNLINIFVQPPPMLNLWPHEAVKDIKCALKYDAKQRHQ